MALPKPTLYEKMPAIFQVAPSTDGKPYSAFKLKDGKYVNVYDLGLIDQTGQPCGLTGRKMSLSANPKLAGYVPTPGDYVFIEANTGKGYALGYISGVQLQDGSNHGYVPPSGGVIPPGTVPYEKPGASAPAMNPFQAGQGAPAPNPFRQAATSPFAAPTPAPTPTVFGAPVPQKPAATAPSFTPPAMAAPSVNVPSGPRAADAKDVSIVYQSMTKAMVNLQIAYPDETVDQIAERLSALCQRAAGLVQDFGVAGDKSRGANKPAHSVAQTAPVTAAAQAPQTPQLPPVGNAPGPVHDATMNAF